MTTVNEGHQIEGPVGEIATYAFPLDAAPDRKWADQATGQLYQMPRVREFPPGVQSIHIERENSRILIVADPKTVDLNEAQTWLQELADQTDKVTSAGR